MEDCAKFRLKSKEELASLFEGRDNLFIVACKKCFKEFTLDKEPELAEFLSYAAESGKKIAGTVEVDFLCNKTLAEKVLKAHLGEHHGAVFVIACGLGVQTVASLTKKMQNETTDHYPLTTHTPLTACDSLESNNKHSLALTKGL